MPWAAPSPCVHPRCPNYAVRNGRCEAHAPEVERERGSSSARGYDSRWRRFRERFLRKQPLCQDCSAAGRIEAATEVHHKLKIRDRPELRLVESNCMALCGPCHDARTARGE